MTLMQIAEILSINQFELLKGRMRLSVATVCQMKWISVTETEYLKNNSN